MLTVAFAQFAIAAHACPLQSGARVAATPIAAIDGKQPCAGMEGAPAGAQANACEGHCGNAIGAPAHPDLPVATLSALPAPACVKAEGSMSDHSAGEVLPVSRAPPLTLQFCRLLI